MRSPRILAMLMAALGATAAAAEPGAGLPRSQPEAQGVHSEGLLRFVERADREIDALHSLMIVRHGQVIAEGWWAPYEAKFPHQLYSLSKSFTSTAVGLAVAEGKLSLDDPVLKFFPEDAPAEPSANLKAMRVSDLLRMSTGHQAEPALQASSETWTKTFLAQPVPFKPGTHFLYNTPATYMLSAIVQKVTGTTVLDYLRPRLFDPLGIENPTWGTSPQGVSLGGYGLNLRTEDIAKFGQLYLQKGKWRGRQLVPETWIDAATARQTSNGSNPQSDWDQGYGYQFWRCRNNAYRGDGAFGQYCIVLPEHDAVIAITSGVKDMQAVLDLVWSEIVPAFQAETLPPAPDKARQLHERLAGLSLPRPDAVAPSELASQAVGRTFQFPENAGKLESIRLETVEDGKAARIVARVDGRDQSIPCRPDAWARDRLAVGGFPEQPTATAGAWTAPDTYTARICLVETPFVLTWTLQFEGDSVTLQSESNVGFGPTRPPALVGRAVVASDPAPR